MTEEASILNAAQLPEEQQIDNALRPQSLAEFTGQPDLKDNLTIFIQSAKKRGGALDHERPGLPARARRDPGLLLGRRVISAA